MIRLAVLSALVLLAPPALAQEPAPAERQEVSGIQQQRARVPNARLFEIHSGRLWLDGEALPPEAVPEGLDISGTTMWMQFSGAGTPVVNLDGVPYVLEDERLVPFESSVVNDAYRRQLSDADQELYSKLQREVRLEGEIRSLARRARSLAPGDEYDALVGELRKRLADLFDLKHEIRVEELDRAEDEIRELRGLLSDRASMRDKIVDHRLRELVGEAPIEQ